MWSRWQSPARYSSKGLREPPPGEVVIIDPPAGGERRKFYFDDGQVEIAAHLVYHLDPDGRQLRVVRYVDFTAEKVRDLVSSAPELRSRWADPEKRSEIIGKLQERGISFDELSAQPYG